MVLLRHRRIEDVTRGEPFRHRSALTIGVLARVDELGAVGPTGEGMELAERVASEWAGRPEVRRRCSVVVPVAGLLARSAAALTEAQYQALRQFDEQPPAELAAVPVPAGPTAAPDSQEQAGAPMTARPSPTRRPRPVAVTGADTAVEQELLERPGCGSPSN